MKEETVKNIASNWQLSLLDALRIQSQTIGVDIVPDDFRQLNSFEDCIKNSRLQDDLQLSVELYQKIDLNFLPTPCIVSFRSSDNTPFYAVVLAINEQNQKVKLASINYNEEFIMPITAFWEGNPSMGLVIRKKIERIYQEQDIESDKQHWFWEIFKHERPVFAKVLLASLFANLLAIITSFFSLQVYDRVVPNKSEETLWALLIGVMIAFALEATLRIVRSTLLDFSGKKIDVQATSFLLRRLLGLRLKNETPPPNRLSQMMREFNSIREFFTEAAVGSLVDIPFVFLFIFVIYAIGGQVVWVAIISMLLMVIPPILLRKKMMNIVMETLGSRTAANRLFNEVSYQLDTVKITQSQRFFNQQWDDISEIIADISMRQRHLVSMLTQWAASLQQIAYVLTVSVAVYYAFDGKITMGAIIAMSILVSRTLAPITRISTLLIRWAQVKSSLDELDLIAKAEQDDPIEQKKLRRQHIRGSFQLNNIIYQYEKDARPALQINNLTIRAGEKIGILGPNGSGKSTLLRLLSGLQYPLKGEIKLDGIDIRQIFSGDLRNAISTVSQEIQLFSGTLRQNLTFNNPSINDDTIMSVLHQTGLSNFLPSHPHGFDLMINDGGTGLSVGHKQSVQVARMLLSNSQVLLLDEPTASLDPNVEASIIRTLANFSESKTFIAVTHRTPILAMVDRIIVIADGYIVADGARDEVLRRIQTAQAETTSIQN